MKISPIRRAAALVFALSAAAAQAQVSDNVVRIGLISDVSGVFADLAGQGSVIAAKMAIDDFVAKEKPPFKVELVSVDHQNKADIAANKAREWFERGGVDAVVDLTNSSVALAVMKIAKEKNRLALITGAGSMRITNEDCNDVSFNWVFDTYAGASGVARAMVKQGQKKWFFVTADYAFGHSLEKDATDIVKAGGGEIVGSARHPVGSADLSSLLLKAQSSGAQVVALANAGQDALNSIKQAGEFGITPKQALAGLILGIIDVHAAGLPAMKDMYLTEYFYWNLDDTTRAWSKRYFDQRKRMPSPIPAGTYSAVLHYLKAVKAAGSDDTQKVVAQMKKLPISDGLMKNASIREDGRVIHDTYLVQVKKPGESNVPWDYFNVRSTIPAAEAFQPLATSKCALVKS